MKKELARILLSSLIDSLRDGIRLKLVDPFRMEMNKVLTPYGIIWNHNLRELLLVTRNRNDSYTIKWKTLQRNMLAKTFSSSS